MPAANCVNMPENMLLCHFYLLQTVVDCIFFDIYNYMKLSFAQFKHHPNTTNYFLGFFLNISSQKP